MEAIFIIILIIFQSILIISALFLLIHLIRRLDIFPYANISSLWTITLLFCVLSHQVFEMIIFCIKQLGVIDNWMSVISLLNFLFIHYLLVWPILGRFYYISKCMKFSFSFLTKNVYLNFLQINNNLDWNNQLYSEGRTKYLSKIIFFPFFSLFFVLLLLTVFKYTRCFMYSLTFLEYINDLEDECLEIVPPLIKTILIITKICLDMLQMFLFLTFLTCVYRYPLKRDQFLLRYELTVLFFIWLFFHHIVYTLKVLEIIEGNSLLTFFLNISEDFCYVLLILFLILKRNKIDIRQFNSMLYNYDLFMQNPVCFNFLKEYIKISVQEEYNYLIFYIDYLFYKKYYGKNLYNENIDNANIIFCEYFLGPTYNKQSRISNRLETPTSFIITMNNNSQLGSNYIDFPIDIKEKVEEYANLNFMISFELLSEAFDDAFEFVNNKLYNRYLMMFRDENEYKKLEKLICYFDFDVSDSFCNTSLHISQKKLPQLRKEKLNNLF